MSLEGAFQPHLCNPTIADIARMQKAIIEATGVPAEFLTAPSQKLPYYFAPLARFADKIPLWSKEEEERRWRNAMLRLINMPIA